jgi:hypothetical protein
MVAQTAVDPPPRSRRLEEQLPDGAEQHAEER